MHASIYGRNLLAAQLAATNPPSACRRRVVLETSDRFVTIRSGKETGCRVAVDAPLVLSHGSDFMNEVRYTFYSG